MSSSLKFFRSSSAAGTNGRLDFSRGGPVDGYASLRLSRWPGSNARRASLRVAPLRRSSAGSMPATIGKLTIGVGRKHPVTIRNASLMVVSIRPVCALRHQAGAQYSAVECTRAKVAVRSVEAPNKAHLQWLVESRLVR